MVAQPESNTRSPVRTITWVLAVAAVMLLYPLSYGGFYFLLGSAHMGQKTRSELESTVYAPCKILKEQSSTFHGYLEWCFELGYRFRR